MFFALKNVSSVGIAQIEKPWEHPSVGRYPTLLISKDAWSKWINDQGTDHCFVSMVEGVSSSSRVNDDNQAFLVHGLIVDYDATFPVDGAAQVAKYSKKYAEWRPTWVSTSFSDNAHVVYEFEKPVLIAGNKHYAAFAREAAKALRVKKLLPGLDESALESPAKYYDIGRKWEEVSGGTKVPMEIVSTWAFKAGNAIRFAPAEVRIPLDVVKAEIDRKWPGKWVGNFDLGTRSVRFWDPSADNTTAAILREGGFQCFTGPSPFVSWREILGGAFCQQYEASRIGVIEQCSAYDGSLFWYKNPTTGEWADESRVAHSQMLRVMGFEGDKRKGKTDSEIDVIQRGISDRRRVRVAAAIPHMADGITMWNGQRILNTSTLKCLTPIGEMALPPNPTFDTLKEYAPFIHAFLEHFFDGQGDQLWHFLAWLKYFYSNGLAQTPKPGHAVLIAGAPSAGKTFLSQAIITPLVGGRAKAGNYFLGLSKWTGDIMSMPLAVIDDEVTEVDPKKIQDYTARIKEFVANSESVCSRKYRDEITIPFYGRVLILTNVDPHSLARCMPDLSLSTRDKFSLFKASSVPFPLFTDRETHQEILSNELPYFAQWLLDWAYPESTVDSNRRFGVKAYHHPELLAESRRQGGDEIVWGLICRMIQLSVAENRKQGQPTPELRWRGDFTKLYSDLHSASPHVMKDYKIRTLQLILQSIERRGAHKVRREIDNGLEIWDIAL